MAEKRDMVRKIALAPEVSENAEQKTFIFTASDDSVDRYGDTIDATGWDLKNFEANPVILLNHQSRALPVGMAVRTWVEGNKLKTEVKFAPEDVNPDGPRVENGVRKGFIRALSVGFKPIEATEAKDRKGDGWFPPQNFKKQELLEISVVTVPANPNALLEAKASEEDVAWIRECALRTLEQVDGPGRWVTRGTETAFRALERAPKDPDPKSEPSGPDEDPALPEKAAEQSNEEIAELVRSATAEFMAELTLKRTGKLS